MSSETTFPPNQEYKYVAGGDLIAHAVEHFKKPDTRESRLEVAIITLMFAIDQLHMAHQHQSLEANLENRDVVCGCADAYRMGHEALKKAN